MKQFKKAYTFKNGEMAILNIWQGSFEPPEDLSGESETWSNCAYELLPRTDEDLYAPDYEGTTTGSNGINILMPSEDLAEAQKALRDAGFEFSVSSDVDEGHYGDGDWSGFDVLKSGDELILLVNF